MTEAILLGNVAMRAGGKFKWNKKLTTNRKDANKLVSKAYRSQWGFELPDLILRCRYSI